ncbi:MAG: transporter [Gemmatimonadaceae bacterium]
MSRKLVLLGIALALVPSVRAQEPKAAASKAAAPKEAPPIADNSFLMEEAYNQEYGVVQHISAFQRSREGQWVYAFTQEWPAPNQKHQLSYTVPVLHLDGVKTGVGDVAINYRYQAVGADDEPLWFSPRLSVYLPTGNANSGRGAGGLGVEVNLPVSYALSEKLVTHWNAGGSFTRLQSTLGGRGSSRGLRGGVSAIWLLAPTFNVMLESVASRIELVDSQGRSDVSTNYVVSPGVRGAINFRSGLQIVPGIAVPIGVGASSGQRDLFLYLSFEHPFR